MILNKKLKLVKEKDEKRMDKFFWQSWKHNCFAPTFLAFLIKAWFKRYDEEKSFIHDSWYEVRLNYKKKEHIFTFSDWTEKFFKTQTELRNYIINILKNDLNL